MKRLFCFSCCFQHVLQVLPALQVPVFFCLHGPLQGVQAAFHRFQLEHRVVLVCVHLYRGYMYIMYSGVSFIIPDNYD